MTNGERAEHLIKKYGFDFDKIPKDELTGLIQKEISEFKQGSSEYIRLLCGYLYCISDGSSHDIELIEKSKYSINMDVGCMIDSEWIDSLKNGGCEDNFTRPRKDIINDFISYYTNFHADDEW